MKCVGIIFSDDAAPRKEVMMGVSFYHRRILPQHHIVAGARHYEDDGCDVVKDLDPLASFVTLTSHVEHTENKLRLERMRYI